LINLYGYGSLLVDGLFMTIKASIVSFAIAILLGLVGAGAKLSNSRIAKGVAETYTIVIRGIPELVLLLLIYYGGTVGLQKIAAQFGRDEYIDINAFIAGVSVIGFVYGAFATEVFRGAILAVPKGQIEAAKAVGMHRLLMWRRILMPQVMRHAIPGLGNVWLVLLKATALMSVIGLDELTRKGFIAMGATKKPFTFFIVIAFAYLGMTIVSTLTLEALERRANRGVRRA